MPLPEKVAHWFDIPSNDAHPEAVFFMAMKEHMGCRLRVLDQLDIDEVEKFFKFAGGLNDLSRVKTLVEWFFDNVEHPFLFEAQNSGNPGPLRVTTYIIGFTNLDEAALFKLTWFTDNKKV